MSSNEDSRFMAIISKLYTTDDKFVYGLKSTKTFCRSDCTQNQITRKSSIEIFDDALKAMENSYKPCDHCKPQVNNNAINETVIDNTVMAVNASIGLDFNFDESNNSRLRHHRSASSIVAPTQQQSLDGWTPRRASISNGHIPLATSAITKAMNQQQQQQQQQQQLGTHHTRKRRERGDSDHLRLVDEACHHIAAAAAAAAVAANSNNEDDDNNDREFDGNNSKLQRKKRRGGILGFKELASKAGLSPWHFHRVFRSVTGLTPKAYGEACWNAVTLDPSLPSAIAAMNMNERHNGYRNDERESKSKSSSVSPLTQSIESLPTAGSTTTTTSYFQDTVSTAPSSTSSNSPIMNQSMSYPTSFNTFTLNMDNIQDNMPQGNHDNNLSMPMFESTSPLPPHHHPHLLPTTTSNAGMWYDQPSNLTLNDMMVMPSLTNNDNNATNIGCYDYEPMPSSIDPMNSLTAMPTYTDSPDSWFNDGLISADRGMISNSGNHLFNLNNKEWQNPEVENIKMEIC